MTIPAPNPAQAKTATRRLGVEEEFHLVDLSTRRLIPSAPALLERLSDNHYGAELQRCVVELNSEVVSDLGDLRTELVARRRALAETAREFGVGIVAAGTVPLSVPSELRVTATPRYQHMLAEYQLLAREQLICGTQIHVDVAGRDEGVAIADRIAIHLPVLLALSASSPYRADGSDTGYASGRTLIWQRWPTTGLNSGTTTAAEYDALVDRLIASGIITDPGMIYFDIRPTRFDTLELRICDSCPSVETIVLIAGLFRALVARESAALAAGEPAPSLLPPMGRAAVWRAARSGLEGDLIDPISGMHRPAAEMLSDLVESLQSELIAQGDWELISSMIPTALMAGSSAARQRRAMRRRGRLSDVVDLLLAETAGSVPEPFPDSGPDLFAAYGGDHAAHGGDDNAASTTVFFDEAFNEAGEVRPAYAGVLNSLTQLGASGLRQRMAAVEDQQRADGITFRVSGQSLPRSFPIDLVPRLIGSDTWDLLNRGAAQRARALNAFLADIYGPQEAIADGVLAEDYLDRAPGFRSTGLLTRGIHAHICGLDLVQDGTTWRVLEDNLRIPSGAAYAMWARDLVDHFVPELPRPGGLLDLDGIPDALLETLVASAPAHGSDNPQVVLVSTGPEDSAYAEHRHLAELMGVPVILPRDLVAHDRRMFRRVGSSEHPVDVIYARVDEDMLLSSLGANGEPLRLGIIAALHRGTLTIANALGNGIGDDKAVYSFVPEFIRYYLGEEPILDNVPTYLCAQRDQRDYVLENLESLVTKPIDGLGGRGVVIGPDSSESTLETRRRELLDHPEWFIAQEVVGLTTVPTFDDPQLHPRHVDLRVFAHMRPNEAVVLPAALTRVGAAGNRIVNSSAGGGCKDTWVVAG